MERSGLLTSGHTLVEQIAQLLSYILWSCHKMQLPVPPEQSTPAADPPLRRSTRETAKRGQEVVKQWITSLRAPPEDVPEI